MKKISIVVCLLLTIFIAPGNIFGQKSKTKTAKRNVINTVTVIAPKQKTETENWQENDFKDLKIKLSFPKTPTRDENKIVEGDGVLQVKSTVIQSYINGNYYMIEIREYPKNFLPKRSNLGESYANWFKTYMLARN